MNEEYFTFHIGTHKGYKGNYRVRGKIFKHNVNGTVTDVHYLTPENYKTDKSTAIKKYKEEMGLKGIVTDNYSY